MPRYSQLEGALDVPRLQGSHLHLKSVETIFDTGVMMELRYQIPQIGGVKQ